MTSAPPFLNCCLGPSLDSCWEVVIYLKKYDESKGPQKATSKGEVADGKLLDRQGCQTTLQHPDLLEGQWWIPPGEYQTSSKLGETNKVLYLPRIVKKNSNEAQEFLAEEQAIVMFKAALGSLTGGVALYAIVNMALNILRTVLNMAVACINIYEQTVKAWQEEGGLSTASTLVTRATIDITYELALGAWSIMRIPFYAIAFEVALLYTIICPYDGRELVSSIERSWHYPLAPIPKNYAFQPLEVHNGEELDFVETVKRLNSCVFYFFFCYQPLEPLYNNAKYVRLSPYRAPSLSFQDVALPVDSQQ